MDTRQSFYLASRQDDFAEPAPPSGLDSRDIPYVMATNDNLQVRDRLLARCAAVLRRLIGRHSCGKSA